MSSQDQLVFAVLVEVHSCMYVEELVFVYTHVCTV